MTLLCLIPEIPHMRDQKESYKGISEFYFENLKETPE
jgi:hypothetical protein